MVAHGEGSQRHMLVNTLLGISVLALFVLIWTLPFKDKIFKWFDQRWGR